MVSDIYTEKNGIAGILSEVEKIGNFCGLQHAHTDKLRLLAEEMLGLTVRLFSGIEYEFFVESKGNTFTLNLKVDTFVNGEQKEKMLSLSSSGKNEAAKGFFGKITDVFETLVLNDATYDQGLVPYYDSMGLISFFSFTEYQDEMNTHAKQEQWDELEKSIIASIAKDVVIGVRNNKVEMIVTAEF
ncbi:MAG: hypothetical protein FWG87_06660 [Defluviitaleaceae bacterium]|nr:hypothetical protein [Defluviitaleaceae bacterium]